MKNYTPPEYYQELLDRATTSIIETLESIKADFDGSEYQQGKKDGLRIALTFLTDNPRWAALNRPGPA